MIRLALAAALLLGTAVLASAQTTLRVGDQKGNSQAVMEAAGVLKDVPYKIEWKEFPAAAPLLEALGAGAIETGLVGDAPFTFAAAANKNYTVEYRGGLDVSEEWHTLATVLADTFDRDETVEDPEAFIKTDRYYRVVVR